MTGGGNGITITVCCGSGGGGGGSNVIPYLDMLLFKGPGNNDLTQPQTGDWRYFVRPNGDIGLDNFDGTNWIEVTVWNKVV